MLAFRGQIRYCSGSWNSEIFSAISGLIGAVTGVFVSKKPRGEGVGKKSDAKISAINNPENREGEHPFQFWIAQLYFSVAPSTPAELFSNDHIQKGGKPLHREEDLKYMACRHLAFSSFSGEDNYATS